mgnify:CR=1 FL=1
MGEDRSSRKEAIMKAALSVFSQHGFHAARIEDISREAGVGKGTIYQYFSSKEDLFRAMLIDGMERYVRILQSTVEEEDRVRDRIRVLFQTNLYLARTNSRAARVILEGLTGLGDEMHDWFLGLRENILSSLENLVREGIERGELRPVNPRHAAYLLLGVLHTLAVAGMMGETEDETISDMVLMGLEPR